MTAQLDHAYRVSREAMLACLNTGFVDADGLRAMQAGMSNVAPHRHAFGSDRYDELPRDGTLYLVCAVGARSMQVARYLDHLGFDVRNVAGGTGDWIAAGFPVQHGPA